MGDFFALTTASGLPRRSMSGIATTLVIRIKVSETRFRALVANFDERPQPFKEIYFYYNPGRFHPLYKSLLVKGRLRDRVSEITHLWDIE